MARWRESDQEGAWIEESGGSLRLRGYASAAIAVGWLLFLILWLFFAADKFSIYRNLAIIFLSLVVAAALLGVLWVSYGLNMGMRYAPEMSERRELQDMKWRIVGTTALWGAWAALVIVWLYFFADGLSGYQNVAVFIVSVILAAIVSSLMWRRYMSEW